MRVAAYGSMPSSLIKAIQLAKLFGVAKYTEKFKSIGSIRFGKPIQPYSSTNGIRCLSLGLARDESARESKPAWLGGKK
jgi:hypothetical protein